MVKLRIEYDKAGCIGAAACVAVDPQRWVLDKEGKADLVNAKTVGNLQVLEVDVADPQVIVDSAKVCPVVVIKVFDAKTNEQLAP